METADHTWALVLAAGEGSRLRSLTTMSSGVAVPKQFCSLHGGPSLLHDAIERALAIAPLARTCTIVAEQHRRWWERALGQLAHDNVIVQPENRGTAIGVLLSLLHILERDPHARVVLLPSDHYVRDETVLAQSLQKAAACAEAARDEIVLLGLTADCADPELGYIVPGGEDVGPLRRVERFVEKPTAAEAATLIARGALWNVFIVAARAQTLLDLYLDRCPQVVAQLRRAAALDARSSGGGAVRELYGSLPIIDFSRDILEHAAPLLRVLPAPACGWSDLGTPERLAHTLRCAPAGEESRGEYLGLCGYLNLAQQHSLHAASIQAC